MLKLKNVKIKVKLIVAFIIVTFLASISGIYSVFYTGKVNDKYSYAIHNYGFAQGEVGKVMACFGSIDVSVHDVIGYVDQDAQADARGRYDTQIAKMDGYFSAVEGTLVRDEVKEYFNTAKKAWEQYVPLAEELMKEGDSSDAAIIQQVQNRLVNELQPLYDTIYTNMTNVMFEKVNEGNATEESLTKGINQTRYFVAGLIVAAILLSFVLGTVISKSIANPIYECAKRLRALAAGDLHTPVPEYDGKDECGILINSTKEIVDGLISIIGDEKYLLGAMADGDFDIRSKVTERYIGDFTEVLEAVRKINRKLSQTLTQISVCADQVTESSGQVSGAAQNLSQGATEQASTVEGVAESINLISDQIKNNADNALLASQKAQVVGEEIEKSNDKMSSMMDAMTEISSSSSEIGKIIKTIEDIAFQTNILALNAAVEAARAGEAGKGFAVVADEVRNLASKSSEASKNTAQLIEASIRAVENGTKIADETADALRLVVTGVEEVVTVVEKISTASVEQSESVQRVNQNVEQISSVIQTYSATAEESAAASEELAGQAQILNGLTGQFHLRCDG